LTLESSAEDPDAGALGLRDHPARRIPNRRQILISNMVRRPIVERDQIPPQVPFSLLFTTAA
jgi:hypothetical protein